jgi:hypothetical protein
MKKILIQLDSDRFASTFDSIVAHDAGVDVVQGYGGVVSQDVRGLVLSAFFTRGIPDLKNLAVWIGGSDVDLGEELMAEVCRTFFGPFKFSVMLDSNGCNTTASTAIAKLARQTELRGKSALVIGCGPVGLRSAVLLAGEGCRVLVATLPSALLGARLNRDLAQRSLASARKAADDFRGGPFTAAGGSILIHETAGASDLTDGMERVDILVSAGPAGLRMVPASAWTQSQTLQFVLDFNLTEPLGVEGIKAGDDFTLYDGKRALGALAIGNPKMKVHKACLEKLFERNDLLLDVQGVYSIAKQII